MSNLSIRKIIALKTGQKYHILAHNANNRNAHYNIVITGITNEEEQILDDNKVLTIERGNRIFTINRNNLYFYGLIDFTNSSEDLDVIDSFDLLSYLKGVGIPFIAHYDYNTHTCTTITNMEQRTETWYLSDLAQYGHGCIDKPEKVVIFKESVK